jgi:hypothetical protein
MKHLKFVGIISSAAGFYLFSYIFSQLWCIWFKLISSPPTPIEMHLLIQRFAFCFFGLKVRQFLVHYVVVLSIPLFDTMGKKNSHDAEHCLGWTLSYVSLVSSFQSPKEFHLYGSWNFDCQKAFSGPLCRWTPLKITHPNTILVKVSLTLSPHPTLLD